MNLYLCSNQIGDYYVIAEDPTSAQIKLERLLGGGGVEGSGYGLSFERKVENIKLLAIAITFDKDKRPEFTGKYLILNEEATK
jgi:hypothetical protein